MADTPETSNQAPMTSEAVSGAPVASKAASNGSKPTGWMPFLSGAAVLMSASALVLSGMTYFGGNHDDQIRNYLLQNPQILDEMLTARQQAEEQNISQAIDSAIAANPQLLAHDARDPAVGPEDAKVTVIQFFDYRCPSCKVVAGPYREMMARHPEVRFVFKEWPILDNGTTVTSNYAARAALAANAQGKYVEVHTALMAERALDEDTVDAILKEAGVDMAKAKQDMASPEMVRHITDIHAIGMGLQLRGTPTFLVNGKTSASIDPDEVERMIAAAQ